MNMIISSNKKPKQDTRNYKLYNFFEEMNRKCHLRMISQNR